MCCIFEMKNNKICNQKYCFVWNYIIYVVSVNMQAQNDRMHIIYIVYVITTTKMHLIKNQTKQIILTESYVLCS